MEIKNELSLPTMWKAIITCDATYDSRFFYAVKTTGIFCRPSCKSRTPKYNNTLFFIVIEDAFDNGFRPCKRCRPDLLSEHYDPQKDIAEQVVTIINMDYTQTIHLKDLAYQVGVSPFHLNRIFKSKMGCTPHMYLEKIRIEKAKELLASTSLSSTEVAYQVGYGSLSSFYKNFRKRVNCSPKEYRAEIP